MDVLQLQQWVGGRWVGTTIYVCLTTPAMCVWGVEVDQDTGRYYYICMSHNSSNGLGVEVDQNMDMYCLMTSMMGEVVH